MSENDTKRDGPDEELELLEELDMEIEGAEDVEAAIEPIEPATEPAVDPAPVAAPGVTAASPAADAHHTGTEAEGQWVWQFAAHPPPPPFSAMFFSGTRPKEFYSFFGCGLLVVLGCLLPWSWLAPGAGEDAVAELVPGFTLPMGSLCLALGIYLVWGACQAIYTGRPRIMPIVLMLVVADITILRLLDAWGAVDSTLGMKDMLVSFLHDAGTGVVFAAVGSVVVSLRFVMTLGKVLGKKDEKKAARKAKAKAKDKPAKEKKAKKPKAEKASKKKDEAAGDGDASDADGGGKGRAKGRRGRKR